MKINLRFVRNEGFVSRAIGWQTWGPGGDWSHVDFALPDGYLGSQAPDGVQLRPLDYCKPTAELKCYIEVPDDGGEKVLEWAHSQIGKPYDYKSIFGFLIKRDWRDDSAWICSEYVAYAFMQAGYPILNTQYCNRVSPSIASLTPYIIGFTNPQ